MKRKNDCYDPEKVKKMIKGLSIPKEYFNFNLDKINENDISMILSIRKDAGKTTQSLLIGMCLNILYGYEIEYLRIDRDQTTGSNISNMFDVIEKFGYIEKIYKGIYNGIEYKRQSKRFYLVKREGEDIITRSPRPICLVHSLEDWARMKSGYNNVNGNWIVVDEIFDTSRSTNNQIIELANQISTITRDRLEARVLMLGNNLNRYSFWFEDFEIEKEIQYLDFGGEINKKTDLGTTIYVKLLDPSQKKKDDVLKRNIRFFGFNSPKMAAFNGLQAFAGNQWQHISDPELLNPDNKMNINIYIFHRSKYIKVNEYSKNGQIFTYLHYASKPRYHDNIILTSNPDPDDQMQIYGFGKYCRNEKVRSILTFIRSLRDAGMWYYSSNSVGDLVEDYLMSIR